jgi:hypothetical protein
MRRDAAAEPGPVRGIASQVPQSDVASVDGDSDDDDEFGGGGGVASGKGGPASWGTRARAHLAYMAPHATLQFALAMPVALSGASLILFRGGFSVFSRHARPAAETTPFAGDRVCPRSNVA